MDWPGLAILLLIGLLIVWVAVALRIGWVLTHPPRRTLAFALAKGWPASPAELPASLGGPRPFEEWTFRSPAPRHRDLPVWDIACDGGRGSPVVIFTHGWGESRLHGLLRMGAWLPVASRVILWDLPGHGEAPRAPASTCHLGADEHEDLLELLARVHESDPAAPVVLHGFSLGAGVSIVAAALARERLPGVVRGVIAEAPYRVPQTPARAVLHHNGLTLPLARAAAQGVLGFVWGHGAWWFTRDRAPRFDRCEWAARLSVPGAAGDTSASRVPLLVVHGEADEICPLADSRAIAAACPSPHRLVVVPGAGHLDLWMLDAPREACTRAVSAFVAACEA